MVAIYNDNVVPMPAPTLALTDPALSETDWQAVQAAARALVAHGADSVDERARLALIFATCCLIEDLIQNEGWTERQIDRELSAASIADLNVIYACRNATRRRDHAAWVATARAAATPLPRDTGEGRGGGPTTGEPR